MKHSAELHQAKRSDLIPPIVILSTITFALSFLIPTNDAAWQIWVGRQILGGARLYRDIVEINPPLWFWAGALLSPGGWPALLTFLAVSAGISIWLARRLHLEWWTPYAMIFVFFLIGISATGQREQFTLIAATPYVLLAAARAEERHIPLRFAVMVGTWAALGIALKHYFVLVPLVLEAWLFCLGRRALRPEFICLCLSGIAYATTIAFLTPDYLTAIVPLVRHAYAFFDMDVRVLFRGDVFLVAAFTWLGFIAAERKSRLVQALTIAGTIFFCIYIVQLKSFRYHGLPALGFFCLAAFALLASLDYKSLRNKIAASLLVLVPLCSFALSPIIRPPSPTSRYLCTFPPGTKVLSITVDARDSWPAVESCGLHWTSRHMTYWTLPSLREYTSRAIIEDIGKAPDIITIDKKPLRLRKNNTSAYQFVMSDHRILRTLRHYRVAIDGNDFVALIRSDVRKR